MGVGHRRRRRGAGGALCPPQKKKKKKKLEARNLGKRWEEFVQTAG